MSQQVDEVGELRADIREIREVTTKEIAELRQRVAELEEELEEAPTAAQEGMFDQHDAAVLDALEVGEVYIGRELIEMFREHTRLRKQSTLKRRAKDLLRSSVFEIVSSGRGRFVGGGRNE